MQHRRLLLPQHPGVQTYASTIDHTCPDGHFEPLSGAVAASQRRGGATARKHADPEFPELTEMGACCRPVTVLHGSYMHTQGLKMIVRVCTIIRRIYNLLICSGSMLLQRLCDPLWPTRRQGRLWRCRPISSPTGRCEAATAYLRGSK